MTPEKFYAALRASGLFARGSSQSQVNGINALLPAVAGLAIDEIAYILARPITRKDRYTLCMRLWHLGLKEKHYEQQKLDRYPYPRR